MKTKKYNGKTNILFEEHNFISSCLKIGLTIADLKEMQYVDVMKILICYLENISPQNNNGTRKATQQDINKFLR